MSIEGKHHYRFKYLKSEAWQTVRIEALAREKGKCQICGEESISNDAHHMWYPESIYETRAEHLVILCRPCHDFIHSMIPECKTRDEEEGRGNWLKFSNAIVAWRKNKLALFGTADGLKIPNPKSLREAYEKLKNQLNTKSVTGKTIKKAEIAEMLSQIKSISTECLETLNKGSSISE